MADVRELKDQAAKHFSKGKFDKAAQVYEQLCKLEPKDMQMRVRLGDAYVKKGDKDKAVSAYKIAAETYARDGFLPRAIAVCKLILEVDPKHTSTQAVLAQLYAKKTGKDAPAAAPAYRSPPAMGGDKVAAPAPAAPSQPPAPAEPQLQVQANKSSPPTKARGVVVPPPPPGEESLELDTSTKQHSFGIKKTEEKPELPEAEADSGLELDTGSADPRSRGPRWQPVDPEVVVAPKELTGPGEIELEVDTAPAPQKPPPAPPARPPKPPPEEELAPAVLVIEEEEGDDGEVITIEGTPTEEPEVILEGTAVPPAPPPRPVIEDEPLELLPPEASTPVAPPRPPPEPAPEVEVVELQPEEESEAVVLPPAAPPQVVEPVLAGPAESELLQPEPVQAEAVQPEPVQAAPELPEVEVAAGPTYEIDLDEEEPAPAEAVGEPASPAAQVEAAPVIPAVPELPPPDDLLVVDPEAAPAAVPPAPLAGPDDDLMFVDPLAGPELAEPAAPPAPPKFLLDDFLDEPELLGMRPAPAPARKTTGEVKIGGWTASSPTKAPPPDSLVTAARSAVEPMEGDWFAPPEGLSMEPELPGSLTAPRPPPAALPVPSASLTPAPGTLAALNITHTTEGEEDLVEPAPPPSGPAEVAGMPEIPLFSDLSREAFIELASQCDLRRLNPGDVIVQEGTVGTSFFVLCSGKVKVCKSSPEGEVVLARLPEGSFFGEMALLSGAPRAASVIAEDEAECLEISATLLADLKQRYPPVGQVLRKFMRQRLLANVMATSPLFRPFDKTERKALVEKFKSREVAAGEKIVEEGKLGDGLYVVMSGEVHVTKNQNGKALPLATLKEGDLFGEISLLTKSAATATVAARKRSTVLRLPRNHFDELILTHPQILMLVSDLSDERLKRSQALEAASGQGADGLMLV